MAGYKGDYIPEPKDNLRILERECRSRKDKPLQNKLRDCDGGFCFLGLGYEVLRRSHPKWYRWEGCLVGLVPDGIDEMVIPHKDGEATTMYELSEWLGVDIDVLNKMAYHNDTGRYSWSELWGMFDKLVKEHEVIT